MYLKVLMLRVQSCSRIQWHCTCLQDRSEHPRKSWNELHWETQLVINMNWMALQPTSKIAFRFHQLWITYPSRALQWPSSWNAVWHSLGSERRIRSWVLDIEYLQLKNYWHIVILWQHTSQWETTDACARFLINKCSRGKDWCRW